MPNNVGVRVKSSKGMIQKEKNIAVGPKFKEGTKVGQMNNKNKYEEVMLSNVGKLERT